MIQGIDVSHFQCDLNWTAAKNEGISFAFVKATEGETYVDPCFEKNWQSGQQVGLKMAPYHFFRSADNPIQQAQFFIETIRSISHEFGLAPALDVETKNAPISKEEFARNLLVWLQQVHQAFGQLPYVYSNHSFANEWLTDPAFAKYPLWIASYDRDTPLIPTAWENVGYAIWQKGQKEIGGVQVDYDVKNKSI